MRILAGLAALLLAATPAAAKLLVDNANGYTLDAAGQLVRFGGLLIGDDGRIERTLAKGEAGPKGVKRLDAKGRTLLPGMIDAHGHVLMLGQRTLAVDLSATKSLAEALAAVRRAKPNRGGAWVLGGGWNQERWKLGRFPTALELDGAQAARPVWLERIDGHAGWANSRALAAAGITAATPDPAGGRIERDAEGRPTGVLIDAAMDLVSAKVPPASEAENGRALRAALAEIASVGLTGVHDAGIEPADWARYQRLDARGELTARIYAMPFGLEALNAAAPGGPVPWGGSGRLALMGVKLQVDGALGSRGARLIEPYADAPGERGLQFIDDALLRTTVLDATGRGFQVAAHAIGDAANAQVLTAFAAVPDAKREGLRLRVEHAQVATPADLARFQRQGAIASVQFTHATSDKEMAEARLGPARLEGAYAWRTLLASGARIAGGSDFPVEPANPFYGLHAAVTRQDRAGEPPTGWRPEQALLMQEAFAAFTTGAAYAGFAEGDAGTLEAGKWADFILVDRDPFAAPPSTLWQVVVEETWLAGKRVFKRRG